MTNNETTLDPINQDAAKACKESNPEPIGYDFTGWYERRGKYIEYDIMDSGAPEQVINEFYDCG